MAKLLDLDVSIPFVRAALDAIRDDDEIDSAVAVVLAAERRHGARLARWIERTPTRLWCLGPRLDRIELTHNLHLLAADYERWLATCLEVIHRKCERQLDDALIVTDT